MTNSEARKRAQERASADLPVATDSTTAERDTWQNGLPVVDMSQHELDALLDYSTSLPTGTTIGKRWKRRLFAGPKAGAWVLGEYAEDPNPDRVAIVWHEIRVLPAPAPEPSDRAGHDFLPVNGHPDDDECTHRADGTDTSYCGKTRAEHDTEPTHHPNCYQSTGAIPDDLPVDLCDCRVLRMIDQHTAAASDRAGLSAVEWASIRALFIAAADEAEGEPGDVIPLDLRGEFERILADRLAVAERDWAARAEGLQLGLGGELIRVRAQRDDARRQRDQAKEGGRQYAADVLARAEAAEQEAATLRAVHERTKQSLRQSEQRVANLRTSLADLRLTETVLRGEIRRSEDAIAKVDEIIADRDALRAQVAAVEALAEECASSGCIHLNELWGRLRTALGDPGPWVDRLKTEGAAEALEQAADALKPRPGKPCERPENCCGTAARCDAVVPMARIVGEDWLRERARVLRDGEPS